MAEACSGYPRLSGSEGGTGFHKRQRQKSDRQAKAARVQKDQVLGLTLGQALSGDPPIAPWPTREPQETLFLPRAPLASSIE